MTASLTHMTCEEFASRLAAREPVPGGGGASALVGALAAALASMVGSYTVGKPRYANVQEDVRSLMDRADALRVELLALVDADAEAYAGVGAAYALAKDDPSRTAAIEAACLAAAEPPLAMMGAVAATVEVLGEMAEKGSRLLLSDVGCGAFLARAALESAALNVRVNTSAVAGSEAAAAIDARCDELLADWSARAEALGRDVAEKIAGRS